MPILTFPLALIGLAAPLGLVGIYLLRNRFRRQAVSSLLLWADHRSPREGGAKVQRWRAPWLFLLELLAMLLLVAAAIGPRWLSSLSDSPVMLVLDDSYSMQATDDGGQSALARAKQAAMQQIGGHFRGRLILAGREPRVLGSTMSDAAQARGLLDRWQASSGAVDLPKAIALATELGGARARVMVLTDHKPASGDIGDRVQWRAFGTVSGNVALVSAARDHGRVMVEVANDGDEATNRDVSIEKALNQAQTVVSRVTLGAGEMKRLAFDVGEDAGTVTVSLAGDALAADDRVVLPAPPNAPATVWLKIDNEPLRQAVRKALEATGRVRWMSGGGELVISDQPVEADLPRNAWAVRLVRGQQVRGYVGPFVTDRGNVLVEGLGLQGVVWGAGEDVQLQGRPVVMAGDKTLVSEEELRDRRRVVRMALNVEATNLTRLVDWPEWWWNVVQWRAAAKPGLRPVMVRLGGAAELKVAGGVREVMVKRPGDAKPQAAAVRDGRVMLEGDELGVWRIDAGDAHYELAVNALDADESDLRGTSSGSWGRWVDEPTLRREYVNYAWLAALAAMGLLMVHLWMVGESGGSHEKIAKPQAAPGSQGGMR